MSVQRGDRPPARRDSERRTGRASRCARPRSGARDGTILAVLVGASLLGILGALLAIRIAAAIQILLRDWWAHRPAADVSDAYAPAPNGSSAELAQP